MKVAQSCPTLCDSIDCSLLGSSVHGHSPSKNTGGLEWVAMPSSRDLPDSGIELMSLTSPALAGSFFATRASWETLSLLLMLTQSIYRNKCLIRIFIEAYHDMVPLFSYPWFIKILNLFLKHFLLK